MDVCVCLCAEIKCHTLYERIWAPFAHSFKKSTDRKHTSHHKLIAFSHIHSAPPPPHSLSLNIYPPHSFTLNGNFSLIIIIIILWCMMCHILSNEWKIELILLRFSQTLRFPLIIFMEHKTEWHTSMKSRLNCIAAATATAFQSVCVNKCLSHKVNVPFLFFLFSSRVWMHQLNNVNK